jgi:hypothetical protein
VCSAADVQGMYRKEKLVTRKSDDRGDIMRRRMGSRVLVRSIAASLAVCAVAGSLGVAGPRSMATPNFNLEVVLRSVAGGPNDGFGLVKFRQPKDADTIVFLDTWVRDLAPNHSYFLQRATDSNVNDECSGTNWLTLGQGTAPQAIVTDERGSGRADLFRSLAAIPLGTEFDIHFRVIDALSSAVVLESACYQFRVSQ